MPNVGGKKFPYTEEGVRSAQEYSGQMGAPMEETAFYKKTKNSSPYKLQGHTLPGINQRSALRDKPPFSKYGEMSTAPTFDKPTSTKKQKPTIAGNVKAFLTGLKSDIKKIGTSIKKSKIGKTVSKTHKKLQSMPDPKVKIGKIHKKLQSAPDPFSKKGIVTKVHQKLQSIKPPKIKITPPKASKKLTFRERMRKRQMGLH